MPINYKEYPPNWFTEIRPAVLKRAGNCCESCGVPNYAVIYRPKKNSSEWKHWPQGMESEALSLDGFKSTKIILTIAHLDHDKSNPDVKIDRLRAWCQRCHLSYDRDHHIANRRFGRNHKSNNLNLFPLLLILITLFLFSCVSSKPVPEPPVKKTPRLGYDKTM